MDIEAVVLTGGASSRMGVDKASMPVNGEPAATRLVRLLGEAGIASTILGPEGMPDAEPYAGPLAALAAFVPAQPWVFIASCDLPRFDARVVSFLFSMASAADAAIPIIEGRVQPLCGVYRAETLEVASAMNRNGIQRVMAWVETLTVIQISGEAFAAAGLDPRCVQGANTPEEWKALVQE